MKVTLGGNTIEIEDNSYLTELLKRQSLSNHQGIAVAVNNVVISKTKWESHLLTDGDEITVIKATAGG